VAKTTDLADAMLLETERIKRVPVLRDGKLVGIVTRCKPCARLGSDKELPGGRVTADAPFVTAPCRTGAARMVRGLGSVEDLGSRCDRQGWREYHWIAANQTEEERRRCASPPRTSPTRGAWRSTSSIATLNAFFLIYIEVNVSMES
jgi:hypothetical protein